MFLHCIPLGLKWNSVHTPMSDRLTRGESLEGREVEINAFKIDNLLFSFVLIYICVSICTVTLRWPWFLFTFQSWICLCVVEVVYFSISYPFICNTYSYTDRQMTESEMAIIKPEVCWLTLSPLLFWSFFTKWLFCSCTLHMVTCECFVMFILACQNYSFILFWISTSILFVLWPLRLLGICLTV